MQAMGHRSILLALLALAAAACGGSSSGSGSAATRPSTAVSLQLDWYPNPDHVGLFTALDRGLFSRAGLNVSTEQPSDVTDPIKLVAAGRTDLGISYEPELFFAQQQHIPVVAVAALVPTALNSIIARGDERIRGVADLRGKTIGADGSRSTAAYLDTVLRNAGLDPAHDVTVVNVGFDLVPALLTHRVDAVVGAFQNVEGIQFRQEGLRPVIFPVDRHGVPPYDELVLVASASRMRSDPAYRRMVGRFVTALADGTSWAKQHPQQATSIMLRYAYRDYRGIIAASVPATLRLLDTSRLDPAAWRRFGQWMYRAGLLSSPPDARALVASPG
jgi:putative hydroxymethylpyrimidine transport system substrate-binding protein